MLFIGIEHKYRALVILRVENIIKTFNYLGIISINAKMLIM
jgi:hypothetical protein